LGYSFGVKSELSAIGRRVDLNLVVVFDAVYRHRNLTAAGRALGLSQPAMSHALARLRHAFRDPLFIRLPRGLQPTPFADDIAPALVSGLASIRGSFERTPFDPATSTRAFNILMGDMGEVVLLPPMVRETRALAPGVRLQTRSYNEQTALQALADGSADIAVGSRQRLGAGCRAAVLYQAQFAGVARAGHPISRSRVSLERFRKAEHLLVKPLDRMSWHGEVVGRALKAAGAQVVAQVASFHGVAALVTQTELIAIVPERLARAVSRMVDVYVFQPPLPLPTIEVLVHWHDRYHSDPGNVWLRELCLRLFAEKKKPAAAGFRKSGSGPD
jgi:DNA-binding transcriptional LysR family regulator